MTQDTLTQTPARATVSQAEFRTAILNAQADVPEGLVNPDGQQARNVSRSIATTWCTACPRRC